MSILKNASKVQNNAANGRCRLRAFLAFAAMMMASMALAEDFIVEVGESKRIEGEKTYGRIFCNGELEIADEALVTCTTFVMASGIVQNVKVSIGNDAQLVVNGASGKTDYKECAIGMNGGAGSLILGTNAVLRCTQNMGMQILEDPDRSNFTAENPFPATAKMFMHLKKGASVTSSTGSTDSIFNFDRNSLLYSGCARFIGNTVLLDEDSYMNFASVSHVGRPDTRILFNGGSIRQGLWNSGAGASVRNTVPHWNSTAGSIFYLTATNGNPVVIDKRSWSNGVFNTPNGGASIYIEGDGDFIVKGSGNWCPQGSPGIISSLIVSYNVGDNSIKFNNTGAIRIEGSYRFWLVGGLIGSGTYKAPGLRDGLIANNLFKGNHDLYVGPGITLDICGNTLKAKKAVIDGVIYSSTNTEHLGKLYVGLDGSDCKVHDIGTNVVCIKYGTGSLVMSNATDMAGLTVTTGAVTFAENASGPVHIRSLEMGKNTSFALGGDRPFTVDSLTLDSSATVAVDNFAPAANGSLDLLSFTPTTGLALLPFTAQSTTTPPNLSSWSLYYAGVLQGAVGAAVPEIRMYKQHLTLGTPGTMLTFK
ncbi:MAG: hypothetical protein IKO72_02280 [Kiritimatiellae bacterium]|nr:hypothetical protein [Kiritimatiellia bacterium]